LNRKTSVPVLEQVCVVMVGLPARGKTFIAGKLARYLRWRGYETEVFNLGDYRRRLLGNHHRADFFDPANEQAAPLRQRMATVALDDLAAFFQRGGEVAIYDATNTTRERRDRVRKVCEGAGVSVFFVESICEDPALVEANIQQTKLDGPDYGGVPDGEAMADFRKRIGHYERAYEPVGDAEGSYVKYIDVGTRVVVHRIAGYLPGRLVSVLLNMHLGGRPILLTRHGQSSFNEADRIGGDPPLHRNGLRYARALSGYLQNHLQEPPVVFTSTMLRTLMTADELPWTSTPWRLLDEIDAGICDGMTYAEIERRYPDIFAARARDKFWYRYPRGESYADVIARLEPVIFELERRVRPVLVIAHQAVLRAVYAYLRDLQPEQCPHLEMPLHTLIELSPSEQGFVERRISL